MKKSLSKDTCGQVKPPRDAEGQRILDEIRKGPNRPAKWSDFGVGAIVFPDGRIKKVD